LEETVSSTIRHRIAAAVAAILALGLFAAACGGDDKDSDSSGSGSGSGSEATTGAPEKITIAYQAIPNGDLIVKHEGWLEEALPDTEIEWKKFDSGGDVNEAFAAGAVDIGLVGSSPVSRGLSQGLEYQVPWIFDVIGSAEALVVRSSTVTSLADLAGKKVATPFASTSHFSLLAALEDANVDASKVEIIDAAPDEIYAAWTRGDIDGAYVWNPTLAKLEAEGGTVLVDSAQLSEKGHTTYDLAVVSTEFAQKYPDAVTTWVEQQNKAVELIKSDKAAAATAIAAELSISEEEATSQLDDLIFLDASEQIGSEYLGGGLGKNLFASAEFNEALGKIDEVKPESTYLDAVLVTFAEKAAKQ
jgi:taurine transport system substrate-binding protein